MTDLERFKAVRIQWHRAVFASHLLTASDKALAAYLVNVRMNWNTAQLNPAVATIANDLSIDHRSVQRCVNRLEHLGWIWTTRGKGRTLTSNYHVTDESIEISQQVKRDIAALTKQDRDAGKSGTSVTLSIVKPWQERRQRVTPLSRKRRQECHSNSKTNNITKTENQPGDPSDGTPLMSETCPVRSLRYVAKDDVTKVVAWNRWLATNGFPDLCALGIHAQDATGQGYMLPRLFVPEDEKDLNAIRLYFDWVIARSLEWAHPSKEGVAR